MPLDPLPSYVATGALGEQLLDYRWDDWKASEEFRYDPEPLVKSATGINPRGRIVLTIGFYEWIIWRFRSISLDPSPFQIAEACWCALVDPRYMKYYEFDRDAWLGPVKGPLWCAITWLVPAVLMSDEDPDELESGLSYLARLAHHVVGPLGELENWTALTLSRLRKVAVATPDDPFDDLFGDRQVQRLGPLLPREVLDPTFPFTSEATNQLIDRFLRTVDYGVNPFLRSPHELVEEGFAGTPYSLE